MIKATNKGVVEYPIFLKKIYIYICIVSCSRVYFIFHLSPTTFQQELGKLHRPGPNHQQAPPGLRKDASGLHHAGHGVSYAKSWHGTPAGYPVKALKGRETPRGGNEQDQ